MLFPANLLIYIAPKSTSEPRVQYSPEQAWGCYLQELSKCWVQLTTARNTNINTTVFITPPCFTKQKT